MDKAKCGRGVRIIDCVHNKKSMIMKHEFFITQKNLDSLRKSEKSKFFEECFSNLDITVTRNSNFFEATDFLLEDSHLSRVDRVAFLDAFMVAGGIVKFGLHVYKAFEVLSLLQDLLSHKYISEEEYESFKRI